MLMSAAGTLFEIIKQRQRRDDNDMTLRNKVVDE